MVLLALEDLFLKAIGISFVGVKRRIEVTEAEDSLSFYTFSKGMEDSLWRFIRFISSYDFSRPG